MRQNPFADNRQRAGLRQKATERNGAKDRAATFTSNPVALKVARNLAFESFVQFQATAQTISYLIAGALRDPTDPAFRRLRASNPALWKRLGPSGFKILEDCGYERYVDGNEVFYALDNADERALREIEIVLNMSIVYGQQWLRMQLYSYSQSLAPRQIDDTDQNEELQNRRVGQGREKPPLATTSEEADSQIHSAYSRLIKDCDKIYATVSVGPYLREMRSFLCNVLQMKVLDPAASGSGEIDEWGIDKRCMLGYDHGQRCIELVEGDSLRSASDLSSRELPTRIMEFGDEIGIISDDILHETLNQGYFRDVDGSVKLTGPGHISFRLVQAQAGKHEVSPSEREQKHYIVEIIRVDDIKASLRFWRDLIGFRVQEGNIFGNPKAILIFADENDSRPNIVLLKSKEAQTADTVRRTYDRHQFTIICPLSQIQLLALLAARGGHVILQPLATSGNQADALILLSPDGNRVRFIPAERSHPPTLAMPETRSVFSTKIELPSEIKRDGQLKIPPRQLLNALIRTHLLALTRLEAKLGGGDDVRSPSTVPIESCKDAILQTTMVLDSVLGRLANPRGYGATKGMRDDLGDSRASEMSMVQSCADLIPNLEYLRNSSKQLLSSIGESKREALRFGKTRSDLQSSIIKAKESLGRFRTEFRDADERLLMCSAMASEVADEWSRAREELQVRFCVLTRLLRV